MNLERTIADAAAKAAASHAEWKQKHHPVRIDGKTYWLSTEVPKDIQDTLDTLPRERANSDVKRTNQIKTRLSDEELFDRIVPNPTVDLVSSGAGSKPDTVIALGGGSAIDSGKAISFIYTRMSGGEKPLCVVIPTTSGTGSEVTSFSVLSDVALLAPRSGGQRAIPCNGGYGTGCAVEVCLGRPLHGGQSPAGAA